MATINLQTAVQALSISIALTGAGGIATISLFDIPELRSQPADRALPMIRWLFSRGSHIFPQASVVSAAGFSYLAYNTLPAVTLKSLRANGYVSAALLAFSIAPFTTIAMIPNNFALIEENEKFGGARSATNAKQGTGDNTTAEESVDGKGQVSEFTDLSDPQTKTNQDSTTADNEKVQEMLGKFQNQNMIRAILLGAGGVVGLLTALA